MTSLSDPTELSSRIAREERAAAEAKCEKSRQAHLGLAQQYLQQFALVDVAKSIGGVSFG